jgi:hypothetical protein
MDILSIIGISFGVCMAGIITYIGCYYIYLVCIKKQKENYYTNNSTKL